MDRLARVWDLIVVLTQKEIKVRYKHYALGYLWSLGNPLAFAFVFYVAFRVVARVPIENYTVFLITGLFPWQWFSNSVTAAPSIFLGNASIIKKVRFPRNLLPLAVVAQDMFHFVLSLPVVALFLMIFHTTPSWRWVYGVPVLLLIHLATTYGAALLIATVNLFFRDMERLTVLAVTFAFYFTPVLYTVSMVPERYRHLIALNPLAPLMIAWRELLLNGALPGTMAGLAALYGAAFLLLGSIVYDRLSWKFAELI